MRITHRVGLAHAAAHLIDVETRLHSAEPLPSPLEPFMAVWTPGSYMVREYARHIESLRCEGGRIVAISKNAWRIEHDGAREITLRYRLYCNELTVRSNHVDASHAYLNGAATFLGVRGHLGAPVEVTLDAPAGWRAATALARVAGSNNVRTARNYDELVDSPIELGEHDEFAFVAAGKPHKYAIWPARALSPDNIERLVSSTRTLIEVEAKLMGGLPHDGFTFILHLSTRARGGLEHRDSTSLLVPPSAPHTREAWLDCLSLIAHEYFHLWNVKRLRPEGLTPDRYEAESYTRMLWWFEGGTSYFDWRFLRLAGLCSEAEYLAHMGTEIAYVEQTPGRLVHSLEDASFDAWIKLYRPDENSVNSSISYYFKGELVCAMLDLEIRARSGGRSSLDAVMVALWEQFGRDERPIPEGAMQGLFESITGCALGDLFDAWIRGTSELDCDATFAKAGLSIERTKRGTVSVGARLVLSGGRVTVASVARGGGAHAAGIDPHDEVLSVAGRRVDGTAVEALLADFLPGQRVDVIISRDGRTRSLELTLGEARVDKVTLSPSANATREQTALREAWLAL